MDSLDRIQLAFIGLCLILTMQTSLLWPIAVFGLFGWACELISHAMTMKRIEGIQNNTNFLTRMTVSLAASVARLADAKDGVAELKPLLDPNSPEGLPTATVPEEWRPSSEVPVAAREAPGVEIAPSGLADRVLVSSEHRGALPGSGGLPDEQLADKPALGGVDVDGSRR